MNYIYNLECFGDASFIHICMVPIGSPLGCSKYSLEMF